ncbi:hypothetical protein [Achromobacter mucicolens]|uniref:hypothetical protein n=1 Tax=Achromobacter mucicolens TaxID=1389922 RepID=UPI0028A75145|nr:hypothetical protein [Achromobacter mucicolens]
MATERKKGGKGLARTEQVAIRFDPRTRYLLELCARVQRRTVTNFVEWAVEEAFKVVEVAQQNSEEMPVSEIAWMLWDGRECVRLFLLDDYVPSLIAYDESQWLQTAKALLAEVGLKRGSGDEREYEFLDSNWDSIKRCIREGMTPQEAAKHIARGSVSLENVSAQISRCREDLERLEALEAALMFSKKNG